MVDNANDILDIDITYITARGKWYLYSWKGDENKSGGLVYNIGIHLFDLLCCLLGYPEKCEVHIRENNVAAGYLEFKKARVKWLLSIDDKLIPRSCVNKSILRSVSINGKMIDMSKGFTDLHTVSYQNILSGNGFHIEDTKNSLILVDTIKNIKISGINEHSHYLLIQNNK